MIIPLVTVLTALAADPAPANATTATKDPDAQTNAAIDALDAALMRNQRTQFQVSAKVALTSLETRKATLKTDAATMNEVSADLDEATLKAASVKAASDTSWQNVALSLKLQLSDIDDQLDEAENNPMPKAAPVTAKPVATPNVPPTPK